MSEKLVLIDGHSILNRAFFGIPDLTNSEGLHTNAVYGFLNILFKILEEEQPNYLTVAFDVSQPTFRHKMYAEYKGTRKPMAEELREQVPLMKEMLKAMGVTIVEKGGYEADDILGTIAKRSEAEGLEVSVVLSLIHIFCNKSSRSTSTFEKSTEEISGHASLKMRFKIARPKPDLSSMMAMA